MLRAQIAERESQPELAVRLLREALTVSPNLLQDELPHLLKLVDPKQWDAVLAELVEQAEKHDFGELKRLCRGDCRRRRCCAAARVDRKSFLAGRHAAGHLAEGPPQAERVAQETARCWLKRKNTAATSAVFPGEVFIGTVPHSLLGQFEAYAIVKLR